MKSVQGKLGSLLIVITILLNSCGTSKKTLTTHEGATAQKAPAISSYKVDPATAGRISGTISFVGVKPRPKLVDMSEDPACVEAHHGKAYDESLLVGQNGGLANVFVYVKTGLEGKHFEPPQTPVTIDQRGCWFRPRVIGIQLAQQLRVVNSDPVTHNIHPLAQINREWNHSQGPGDPPIARKFIKPEIMIPVKCNIHSWMHAFVGVVDNPYFAVSTADGSFQIRNLPPGDYVVGAWHETLGTREQRITIGPSTDSKANFTFRRK